MWGILPIPEIFMTSAGRGSGCLQTIVPTYTEASVGKKLRRIFSILPGLILPLAGETVKGNSESNSNGASTSPTLRSVNVFTLSSFTVENPKSKYFCILTPNSGRVAMTPMKKLPCVVINSIVSL